MHKKADFYTSHEFEPCVFVRDGEGRKIKYTVYQDERGYYLNRFGMRAVLNVEIEPAYNGAFVKVWAKVDYYIDHK